MHKLDSLSSIENRVRATDIVGICIYEWEDLIGKLRHDFKKCKSYNDSHLYRLQQGEELDKLINTITNVHQRYLYLCGISKHNYSTETYFDLSTYKVGQQNSNIQLRLVNTHDKISNNNCLEAINLEVSKTALNLSNSNCINKKIKRKRKYSWPSERNERIPDVTFIKKLDLIDKECYSKKTNRFKKNKETIIKTWTCDDLCNLDGIDLFNELKIFFEEFSLCTFRILNK